MKYKCPICKDLIEERKQDCFPFCSPRCKNIDLYHWLNEEYYIAEELPNNSEDPEKPERFWKNS